MKILDNKKDYYDYLSGVYGIDELIVFDRRDSFLLKPDSMYQKGLEYCFGMIKLPDDKPLKAKHKWDLESIPKRKEAYKDKILSFTRTHLEGDVYHYILEVGWNQYFFEIERWTEPKKQDELHVEYRLIESKHYLKHRYSESPICIIPCQLQYTWRNEDVIWKEKSGNGIERIDNPNLSQTYIPKLLPPTDVWNAVYDYLSSLKDKTNEDNRNDIQKLESAGFDKHSSFRNIK